MKGIILAGGSAPDCIRLRAAYRSNCCRFTKANDLLSAVGADAGRYPRNSIITTPEDKGYFQRLLGDGSDSVSSWNMPNSPARTVWRRPYHR